MPGVKSARDMTRDERARLYRNAAALAWHDVAVTRDERAPLNRLRDDLGLSRDEASRLEGEAAQGAGA